MSKPSSLVRRSGQRLGRLGELVLVCFGLLTLYFADPPSMERPNRKQWVVLWSGAVWTVGSLVIAEDYLFRALLAGFIVTALLFWQLSSRRHTNQQQISIASTNFPAASDHNPEGQQPQPADASTPVESGAPTVVQLGDQQA